MKRERIEQRRNSEVWCSNQKKGVEEAVMGEKEGVFGGLSDPLRENGQQHSLHDILVIALCTILCGGQTCIDMTLFGQGKREFLGSFLKLENGIPSHDTLSLVFRLLDPEAFHAWFLGFMDRFAQGCQGVVALKGKTLRRSYDRTEGGSPLHLFNAWAAEQRLALCQGNGPPDT